MPLQDINKSTWKEDFGMAEIKLNKEYENSPVDLGFGATGAMPSLKNEEPAPPTKDIVKRDGFVFGFRFVVSPDREKFLPEVLRDIPAQIELREKTWLICGIIGANLHLKHKDSVRIKHEIENKLKRLRNSAYLKDKKLYFCYRAPWELYKDWDFATEDTTYKIYGRLIFVLEKVNATTGY